MAKIPVGDTINYAYTSTFGNLLTVVGLTWIPLAVMAGISYYTQTVWFEWLAKFPMFADPGHAADPQAVMQALTGMGAYAGLGFLLTLVSLFLSAMVGVAVTTQALGMRTGAPTYAHVAVGPAEWRVFWGYIRLFFSILGVALIMGIGTGLSMVVGKMMSPDGSGIGTFVAVILCIALVCLALLTIVRMTYLLVPSIVAEPGVGGIARSYHLTSGNFWRIVIISIVLVLPIALVAGAISSAFMGNAMMGPWMHMMQNAQSGHQATPEEVQQLFREMIENFRANFLPTAIINFISSIFLSGLTYSGAAFAYRALAGTAAATPAPAPAPMPPTAAA